MNYKIKQIAKAIDSLNQIDKARLMVALDSRENQFIGKYQPVTDEWKTINGARVEIDDKTGEIKRGMGGKFTGAKLSEIRKGFVGPKTPKGNSKQASGGEGKQQAPKTQSRHSSVKQGHNELTSHIDVVRETEKAVAVPMPGYEKAQQTAKRDVGLLSPREREMLRERKSLLWLPKSQVSMSGGKVTGMAQWLADRSDLVTNEGEQQREEAFERGKNRYNQLLEKAKTAGVKGVRVGMRTTTIQRKMKEAGVEV